MTNKIHSGEPYNSERTAEIVDELRTEGFVHLGPVLEPGEVAALRLALERKLTDQTILTDEAGDHIRGVSLMRMFEYDRSFRDLVVREPFPSLAEAVLGDDCHLMAQNALAYDSGQGGGWHVDDLVHFPATAGCHPDDLKVPCLVMQIFTPLTDMDEISGCTQVVPGSHNSGCRPPTDDEELVFRGRGPVSIEACAGDAYLFHNQIWHRGSKNFSK
ncbi:uncharacterized protein METZ01_LOCUS492113, partial [marine metagenome]